MSARFFFLTTGIVAGLVGFFVWHMLMLPDRVADFSPADDSSKQSSKQTVLKQDILIRKLLNTAEMIPSYTLPHATQDFKETNWGIKMLRETQPWETGTHDKTPVQALLLGIEDTQTGFAPKELIFFIGKNTGRHSGEKWKITGTHLLKAERVSDLDDDNDGIIDVSDLRDEPSVILGEDQHSTIHSFFLEQMQTVPEMQKYLTRYHLGELSRKDLDQVLGSVLKTATKQVAEAWDQSPKRQVSSINSHNGE